jgi:hypothetical protein
MLHRLAVDEGTEAYSLDPAADVDLRLHIAPGAQLVSQLRYTMVIK